MNNANEVLRLAAAELGVKESPAGSNRVKYNTWYYGREVSGSAYPWCMAFVQWVYDRAGIPLPLKTASCGGLLGWYQRNAPECVVKDPVPGCVVIFDFPGTAYYTDHTGIFESRSGDYITTIDGNTGTTNDANGGAVMRRSRHKSNVRAYIVPEALTKEEEESLNMTDKEIYEAVQRYAATLAVPKVVRGELQEAIDAGITDGDNAQGLIPMWRAAVMALRATKK